jgi:two-component system, response regulator
LREQPDYILVVEDNKLEAELLKHALFVNGIHNEVVLARDGVEGIAVAQARAPRLMLLDLNMPRVDGLEVLRVLRDQASTRGIPIVVLTSSRQENDVRNAYRCGANGYVVKPVDIDTFTATIGIIGRYWLSANHAPGHSERA